MCRSSAEGNEGMDKNMNNNLQLDNFSQKWASF